MRVPLPSACLIQRMGDDVRGLWLMLAAMVLSGGCQNSETAASGAKPKVAVSMPPHKFLVQRIGGEFVDVLVVLPPGQSHGTYDPTPQQLVELSSAQAYLTVGVEVERSIVKRLKENAPNLRIADLQQGIELATFEYQGGTAHDHHEGDHHDHNHEVGAPDPHTWLDPVLFARQGHNVAAVLAQLDPEHAELFKTRAAELEKELVVLDGELAKVLKPLQGTDIFVYHAAYGYFARRYGLNQVAIESGGQEPGAEYLARITQRAKEANAKVIFVQPQYSKAQAQNLAATIHAAVVPMDHMSENYIQELRSMAEAISTYAVPD